MKIRIYLFFTFYFSLAVIFGFSLIIFFILPRKVFRLGYRAWGHTILFAFSKIIGVKVTVRGREHVQNEPLVLVCKHQSTWETFFFMVFLRDPVYILKWEMFLIPLYGLGVLKSECITVKRGKKGAALKTMLDKSVEKLKQDRSVIIFPEGTRVAPLTHKPLKKGVAALYKHLEEQGMDVNFVPVAHNAGCFWPRRSPHLRSGEIIVEILPPMPKNLSEEACIEYLENNMITKSDELSQQALENEKN